MAKKESDPLVEQMSIIYGEGRRAWVTPEQELFEDLQLTDERFSASTYGEITPLGASQVIRKFRSRLGPDGVFYDLGCGLGRFVSQVALLTDVKKAVGVELCPNRIAAARELAEKVTFPGTKPTFVEGDFLKQDYSDATIVYVDNTMYTDEAFLKIKSTIPEDCVLVYQRGWVRRGDPFFAVETTYNSAKGTEKNSELFKLANKHAGWTYGGGHEF